jgi:hypothetical protein
MADDRPKAGEADPETRRKRLREILDTPTKGTGVAPKSMKEAVDAGVKEADTSDVLPNGKKRRANMPAKPKRDLVKRYGPKGQTEDEITGQ